MRLPFILLASAIATSTSPWVSAASPPSPSVSSTRSLFERLGGHQGTTRIASSFVDILAKDSTLLHDPKLNELARHAKKSQIKARLSDEICKASGGPCEPSRTPLVPDGASVHLGMMQWLSVIDDANQALDRAKVGAKEKAELLSLLMKARRSAG